MDDLWTLSAPFPTFVLRGVLVYFGLLLFIRLSGKRAIGEFTPFDLVVLILIGEASQNGLIGDDHSVTGALLVAGTLVVINYAAGWVSARSPRFEALLEGRPVLIASDGHVLPGALRNANISDAEFEESLRNAHCTLEEVRVVILEVDGQITIIKNDENAPLTYVRPSRRSSA